jgi:hypothetical protein
MRVSPQIIWLPMPNAFVLCRPLQKTITARLWHRPSAKPAVQFGFVNWRIWTPPRLQAFRSLAMRYDCSRISGL